MASNLGTLTVDVIAKVGAFVDGLSKAERESKKFRAGVEKNLKAAGTAFVALGVAGVAATAALIKSSIDSADALLEQSQMFGVSVELLSSYKLGLEQAGASSSDFATGLKGLANAVDSDAEAFKRLQISTKDAEGTLKSSDVLLAEIANRFASMEDGITKTALAQDLFGKSGIKLIPFLNQGAAGLAEMRAEAERLGLVISQETAEAADQFNDNLLTLKAVVTGTGNELAAALLPRLVEFTELLTDPATQQGIKDIVTGMANMAIKAVELAAAIPNIGRDLAAAFGGAALGDMPRLQEELANLQEKAEYWETHTLWPSSAENAAAVQARIAEVEELIRVSEELQAMANTTPATTVPETPFTPLSATDPTLSPVADIGDAGKKRLEQYQQELSLLGQTGEAAKLRYELEQGSLKGLIDTNKELHDQLLLNAEAIDTEAWFAEYQKKREAANEEQAQLQKQIDLYGETSQAVIYRYEVEKGLREGATAAEIAANEALYEQLDLKKQLAEQAANDEQFEATAAGLQKQIDLLGNTSKAAEMLYDVQHGGYDQFREDQQDTLVLLAQELEEREKMLDEFEKAEKAKAEIMEEFLKNSQNILADFLFDPFKDGLDGMVDQFANMLKRLAAEAVAADVMKFLVGLGKNSGGTGNSWGQAISAFAGLFDTGGSIGAGQWGIVGEMGPEIVRGPAMVTSRKDTEALMSNKNNYNITNVFPNVTSRREAPMAGAAASQVMLGELERIQRMR